MITKTGRRILVVDDDPDIALMVRTRLEAAGYDVDVANTGENALKKMTAGPLPDLIVLDVVMPGPNGYEICARIKLSDHGHIPVVMLTSHGKAADVQRGYLAQADAYIHKPMSGELLLPEVRRLLPPLKDSSDEGDSTYA